MNCPQCQTANGPGSAFCGNCGAQMTVAPGRRACGYPPPQGAGTPLGYGAPGAPTGYDGPQGYNAAGGYNADRAAAARVPAGAVPAARAAGRGRRARPACRPSTLTTPG